MEKIREEGKNKYWTSFIVTKYDNKIFFICTILC